MALVSILLSVIALLCTAIGFFTTPIPVLGTVFSFGAAAIAIGGIVLGGRAITRAKQQGRPNDTARIGVVLNVIALVPALLVALTCGLCNALFSTGNVQIQRDLQWNFGQGLFGDAGVPLPPPLRQPPQSQQEPGEPQSPPEPSPAPAAPAPAAPAPSAPPSAQPQQPASPAPADPSALPPPPLPAGPRK
jgi:pyruvate/2-oxoglutarate dehydrogenase complex dihydrolipoamide acyltransferase (E2) component